MAEIKMIYGECELTIGSEWGWVPDYDEVKEITDGFTTSRNLLGGWSSKTNFATWYLKEKEYHTIQVKKIQKKL